MSGKTSIGINFKHFLAEVVSFCFDFTEFL